MLVRLSQEGHLPVGKGKAVGQETLHSYVPAVKPAPEPRAHRGQLRSGQVRSGQLSSGQVRSGQVRSGQVRSAQVRSGQVTQ